MQHSASYAPLEPYAHYYQREEATVLEDLLQEAAIPFRLEATTQLLDAHIVGSSNHPRFVVKIPGDQFGRVDRLLRTEAYERIAEEGIPEDYYLRTFSNEELLDLLRHQSEWSAQDLAVARLLLHERGRTLSEAELQQLHSERAEQQRKGVRGSVPLLISGYVLALVGTTLGLIPAFIVSFAIGWSFWGARNLARNGKRYYHYLPSFRHHGLAIMILAVLSLGVAWFGFGRIIIWDLSTLIW